MYLYQRNISITAEELNADFFRVTGIMENKLGNGQKDEVFKIEMKISMESLKIESVDNIEMDVLFEECSKVKPKVQGIKGLKVSSGYSKKIKELVGGKYGCTHMVELLIEMGRCANETYQQYIYKSKGLDQCIKEYVSRNGIECLGTNELLNMKAR